MPKTELVGPFLILVSAACFGAMPIFGKLAFREGVTPEELLLLRFAVAAVLLGALLVASPALRGGGGALHGGGGSGLARRPVLTRRLVVTALGLGAIGYATQSSLYFMALDRISAPMVALVLYTYPALVTVAAVVLGRERLTARRISALGVSSAGTLLVLLGGGGVSFGFVGVALAFGAAVTYTVYILVADDVVHRVPPVVLSAIVMTGAAVALAVRGLLMGGLHLHFTAAGWFWVLCVAVVSTVVAMLAFFAGLRRGGPSTAAILSTFEPVVTTGLAALVLQEFLTPLQLLGGLVVLSSVAVLQLRPRTSRPRRADVVPAAGAPGRLTVESVPAADVATAAGV